MPSSALNEKTYASEFLHPKGVDSDNYTKGYVMLPSFIALLKRVGLPLVGFATIPPPSIPLPPSPLPPELVVRQTGSLSVVVALFPVILLVGRVDDPRNI